MTQATALLRPTPGQQTLDLWNLNQAEPEPETRLLTDRCLAECVERALCETGYPALRAVEVSVRGRLVTLLGRVPTHYLKQVSQVAALTIPGVQNLFNDLEVAPSH